MAFIEFNHISKHYAGSNSLAVDDITLHINSGEFITLLGPSGSGKTTILMLLAGFEKPTSGHIRLDGQAIDSLPPHRRNMGVVFQSYSLFPHMTVAQNVAFPLSLRKLSKLTVKTRVLAALDKVRLDEFFDRKPSQLSGGQQQRVALARALVFEPKLLLMDEPLSALDKNLREEMQLEIRRLHRELSVTMVYVTHDQSEAMTLSDRIALFNNGRIEQVANPEELYHAPVNPFVANFLGDNNMLSGEADQIETQRGERRFIHPPSGQIFFGRGHSHLEGEKPKVTLCVRPEFLHVSNEQASLNTRNRVSATLIDVIHQGDHWRLLTRLNIFTSETAPQWLIKISPNSLPQGLNIGQTLYLGFHTQDAWVL